MHDNRLDNIRSLALLMVIMVHTWSLAGFSHVHQTLAYGLYHVVCDCGVPLFVMLSGALLLGRKPSSAGAFFRRRYTRLLVPFVLWASVVYVLSIVVGLYPIHSMRDAVCSFIPYLAENKVNEAYWYVAMIAMLYLITPLLNRALAVTSHRTLLGYLVVGVTLLALRNVWPDLYVARYTSAFLPFLLYYLFGHYAYKYLLPTPTHTTHTINANCT